MGCLDDKPQLKRQLLAAIPFVIAAAAFACSYVGNFYCDNIIFTPSGDFEPDDFYRPRARSYGLWFHRWTETSYQLDNTYVYREGCVNYEKGHPLWEYDAKWRTARAFSCIASIIGGFMVFFQFCAPFLLFDQNYWRCAMVFFTITGICQGLTLIFLDSIACQENPLMLYRDHVTNRDLYPDTCEWSWGTWCSIAGTALWFVTVVSMCIIPAPGANLSNQAFPMMVWDDSDDEDEEDSDDEDEDEDDVDDKKSASTVDEETGHSDGDHEGVEEQQK